MTAREIIKQAIKERDENRTVEIADLTKRVNALAESDPAKKTEGDDVDLVVALKARVDEQAEEIKAQKAFRAEVEKKLAIKPESQGLPSEAAWKEKRDYGGRDTCGRKISRIAPERDSMSRVRKEN
jgi:hypothetical protein